MSDEPLVDALLNGDKTPKPELTDSVSVKGDTCEITKTTSEKVRTLADLIRVCEIDTAEWEIERWTANKWEVAAKVGPKNAKTLEVQPLFQVKAWLKRHTPQVQTMVALRAGLLEDIRSARVKPQPAKRRVVEGDWLFEYAPFDLHLGKYAWGSETVTSYDTDQAAELFTASLEFLLERALKLSDGKLARVLCVFGNDVSHMDGKAGETSGGTRMDVDTRYIRVYRRIVEIHREAVSRLLQVAPVDLVVVPGNHDEITSFHLGEVLSALYETNKHVTVDNSPRLRKYYEFGINLFGFTHGHSEKVSELPLAMAREVPERWSRCSSREWHIGHKHVEEKFTARERRAERPGLIEQDLYSDKGVRIRRLTSLSAHDAWHTKYAYMDRRACDSFVFHREAGFTDHLSFNVDHFTGEAISK